MDENLFLQSVAVYKTLVIINTKQNLFIVWLGTVHAIPTGRVGVLCGIMRRKPKKFLEYLCGH